MNQNRNGRRAQPSNTAGSIPSQSETESLAADLNVGGVALYDRRNSRDSLPPAESRLQITILSDIVDRKEGLATTETVWGDTPNIDYLTRALAVQEVREVVAEFFVSRRLTKVAEAMIPTPMFRPDETAFSKSNVYAAILDSLTGNVEAAQAVAELVLPGLMKLEAVNRNARFSRQISYGFDRVTTVDLRHDVMMMQVQKATRDTDLRTIDKTKRISKQVFGQLWAEEMRMIGLTLLEVVELSSVMDDIIIGVRAHLDPVGAMGQDASSIPSHWRNHAKIQELSTCLPFVRAALLLPNSATRALNNDSVILDTWLTVIVNWLKETDRYHWVSKNEALRHHSTVKIRDPRGKPVALVVHRAVKAVPVGQAVVAIEDASMKNGEAWDISATKDRIADEIQGAYGAIDLSTTTVARLSVNTLSDLASFGYKGVSGAVLIDAAGRGRSLYDIAALAADTLHVQLGASGVKAVNANVQDEREWDPEWWYSVATTEKNLDVTSGVHYIDQVYTLDPIEVLLAAPELVAKDALPARPQLLSANAFNSRVLGFDTTALIGIDTKFSFDIHVAGENLRGAFRPMDFTSMRGLSVVKLVRPFFNESVARSVQDGFAAVATLIALASASRESEDQWVNARVPDDLVMETLSARAARELLKLAQSMSKGFRGQVHQMVVERTIVSSSATGDEAAVLRARLAQEAFAAYADLLALLFFMHIQGMDVSYFLEMLSSEAVQRVCLEMGSDRTREQL